MPLPPFVVGILAGASSRNKQTTVIDVTVSPLLSGKSTVGYGYDGGTHISSGGGAINPTTVSGRTIDSIFLYTSATPDTFELWLVGTGYAKGDIVSILVTDSGGSDLLTVDANVDWAESAGDTYWKWNATDHTLPGWAGAESRTATITHYSI